MFVDTHGHLTIMAQKDFKAPLESEHIEQIRAEVVVAKEKGVEKIITVATTVDDSYNSIKLAQALDGVWATVGIHPCDCAVSWQEDFEKIRELLTRKDLLAKNKTSDFLANS